MKMFFVFSFVAKEVREGTGMIGIRDVKNFSSRHQAVRRMKALKKIPHLVPITRRTIRSEQW